MIITWQGARWVAAASSQDSPSQQQPDGQSFYIVIRPTCYILSLFWSSCHISNADQWSSCHNADHLAHLVVEQIEGIVSLLAHTVKLGLGLVELRHQAQDDHLVYRLVVLTVLHRKLLSIGKLKKTSCRLIGKSPSKEQDFGNISKWHISILQS